MRGRLSRTLTPALRHEHRWRGAGTEGAEERRGEQLLCAMCVEEQGEIRALQEEGGREVTGWSGERGEYAQQGPPCIIKLSSGRGGTPTELPPHFPRNMTWSYCRLPGLMIEELQYMDHGRIDR